MAKDFYSTVWYGEDGKLTKDARLLQVHLFYEYLYNKSIEAVSNETGNIIYTSKAREMHSKLLKNFNITSSSFQYLKGGEFVSGVNKLFEEEGYPKPFATIGDNASELDTKTLNADPLYSKCFKDMAGRLVPSTFDRFKAGNTYLLPLSPYDAKFQDRDAFLRNGSTVLWGAFRTDSSGSTSHKLTDIYDRDLDLFTLNDEGKFQRASGNLYSKYDVSGVSRLAKYMSKKDYAAVADWVSDIDDHMSPNALERAEGILKYLKETGYNYEIKPDVNPGQIKARIKGSKVSIRITDEGKNEAYIGRVLDDTNEYYFTTTNRSNGVKPLPFTDQTVEDNVNLLKYALGDYFFDPKSESNKPVGFPATRPKPKYIKKNIDRVNKYYTKGDERFFLYDERYNPGSDYKYDIKLRSKPLNNVHSSTEFNVLDAEIYLENAVSSARSNLSKHLNVDEIIDNYLDDNFDIDTGEDSGLNNAFLIDARAMYLDALRAHNLGEGYDLLKVDSEDEYYEGSIFEQIRAHERDLLDSTIGTFERHKGKRFNPVRVSEYMDNSRGQADNIRDIEAACKVMELDPEEIRGDDFFTDTFRDRLIKFDEESAVPLNDLIDKYKVEEGIDLNSLSAKEKEDYLYKEKTYNFLTNIRNTMYRSISTCAATCKPSDFMIDDNGIIKYNALKYISEEYPSDEELKRLKASDFEEDNPYFKKVTGYIGQVFVPEPGGYVITKYKSSENHIFVPGYEARVEANKEGESKTVEERTKLKGYEQLLVDEIKHSIRQDFVAQDDVLGSTTNVNRVYKRLYDTRHPLDFFESSLEEGMDRELLDNIIKAEASRVKYPEAFAQESTLSADFYSKVGGLNDVAPDNDNFFDSYDLTGHRNMAILSEESDGYFDKYATGADRNQGLVRYLVPSAKVASDGTLIQGDKDDKIDLFKMDIFRYLDYNPADRKVMVFSNILQSSKIVRDVGIANTTFGGWNQNDAAVVSKEFSEVHMVRGKDGKMRNLIVGDKISDLNGNKGVISLIVDRNADLDFIEDKDHRKAVEVFKNNPQLDICMAPFSPVGRFNAGSTMELMEKPVDFVDGNGKIVEGGIGFQTFMVTHMTVDSKTKFYDDDAFLEGKGRKASAQLAWALSSKNCDALFKELYGNNNGVIQDLREYLIAVGLDMGPDGKILKEYTSQDMLDKTEGRNIFKLPEKVYDGDTFKYDGLYRKETTKAGTDLLDAKKLKSEFLDKIAQNGGFMELPFDLTYPTGEGLTQTEDGKYLLPVMSSYLRSGTNLLNGEVSVHNYTQNYEDIYMTAMRYLHREELLQDPNLDPKKAAKYRSDLSEYQDKAQSVYNRLSNNVIKRHFEGKHNIFRERVMGNRLRDSATAVISPNPTLNIDEIGISPSLAETLKAKDGDHILTWRDPVLRDGGLRYLKAVVIEDQVGASFSPIITKSFDADYDGDSVGLYKPKSKMSQIEAFNTFSIEANLLDYASPNVNEATNETRYPLYIDDGLDTKTVFKNHPEFKERYDKIVEDVNINYNEFARKAFDDPRLEDPLNRDVKDVRGAFMKTNKKYTRELSDLFRESFSNDYATCTNQYNNEKDHVKSLVDNCLKTGAKGSLSKIKSYCTYAGYEFDDMASEDDFYKSIKNTGKTGATRDMHKATFYAMGVKTYGTGVSGMYSQKGMSDLRNICPTAVLELTYPNTQASVQSKHDAIGAAHNYSVLMTSARDLWRGASLKKVNSPMGVMWKPKTKDGKMVPATPKEWYNQFHEIYTSKEGLGLKINDKFVKEVGRAMYNPETKTMMNIEDKTHAAPLDKLAYGGNFDTLIDMSHNGASLFDGKVTSRFAPNIIRDNIRAIEEGYEPIPILKKDTLSVEKLEAKQAKRAELLAAIEPKSVEVSSDNRIKASVIKPLSVDPSRFEEFKDMFANIKAGNFDIYNSFEEDYMSDNDPKPEVIPTKSVKAKVLEPKTLEPEVVEAEIVEPKEVKAKTVDEVSKEVLTSSDKRKAIIKKEETKKKKTTSNILLRSLASTTVEAQTVSNDDDYSL